MLNKNSELSLFPHEVKVLSVFQIAHLNLNLQRLLLFSATALTLLYPPSCSSQGKEIIEFYLKELEDEGITHVPRWTPPLLPVSLPKQTSLLSSSTALPKQAAVPAVSIPLATDAMDITFQDVQQDSGTLQADSLSEILPGSSEGRFPQTESQPSYVLLYHMGNIYTNRKGARLKCQD